MIQMFLEEASVEPMRARKDTQVYLWETCLGTVSNSAKNKDVVFTSKRVSSVVLEQGLFKTS